ncbi:hypothetical protein FB451DRAFT_1410407 [Mycena latifolia]|nr:hypothetical protein FB451DRAFT_1410407 [Mycena latifolia]
MTAQNDSAEYDDSEILALIANLDLRDIAPAVTRARTPPPAPRTPSPRPPAYSPTPHTFPTHRPRTYTSIGTPTVYQYESPTRRGYTSHWSVAGAATQGIPSSHVRAVHHGKTKGRTKKAAYAVFCGKRCGVFLTWFEVEPLVSGVHNCIFRGYASVADARAAFAYAEARWWTRVAGAPIVAIPSLPEPVFELNNPLNGSEALDGRWYLVYRGIRPGVYRSHLECQLNTLGIRGAVHESIEGQVAACRKYDEARDRGDVAVVAPTYYAYTDSSDPFL